MILEAASVVLVLVGDASWRDGFEAGEYPRFAELQERGRTYTHWISNPVGRQSMYELLFGEYPGRRLGVSADAEAGLSEPIPSLPQAFLDAGYRTALFGKWGFAEHDLPAVAGYEVRSAPGRYGFETWGAGIGRNVRTDDRQDGYTAWTRIEDGRVVGRESRWADEVIGESWRAWWEATDGPKLSVLWFGAGHGPWDEAPPASSLPADYEPPSKRPRDRYRAMLMAVDHQLGSIVRTLAGSDTYLLVFSAAGTPDSTQVLNQREATRAKRTVFERGVHCPAVLVGPGIEPGTEDALTSPKDVWALLHAEERIPLGGTPGRDSRLRSEYVYLQIDGVEAIRTTTHLLVSSGRGKQQRLFDLVEDPREERPLLPRKYADQALVERLRGWLAAP